MSFFSWNTLAQETSLEEEEGDKHLEVFAFEKAIGQYIMAYKADSTNYTLTRKIADAFRRKGDLSGSAPWYKRTLELDSSINEDLLYYAEALKTLAKYDESLIWYEKYNKLQPKDDRAQNHLVGSDKYLELEEDQEHYLVKKLDINNRKPAFGVTKFREKLVFSATGLEGQKSNKTNPWNDLPYLDIYESNIDEKHQAVDIQPISKINSKYNDGPAHYNDASSTMFVTRNNMKRGKPIKDKTGAVNLKIYSSTVNEGEWSEMSELPFNSNDYSTGHPAVSKDGKRLYFASNRPGGEGGTDIYVCDKIDDVWGNPENLGNSVNTKGDELFPYIDDKDILYFSSTGHMGLGGMDLFKIPIKGIMDFLPENLGTPLNSAKDDYSILFEVTNESGYFCSNRDKGFSDDIFYFELSSLLKKVYAGRVESSLSEKLLAGTELIVRNFTTGEDVSVTLDENGGFEFDVLPGATYELAYQRDKIEEVLLVKTVEDIVTEGYENLGVFTIQEVLSINVDDEHGEIEINGEMYARVSDDGKFVSEQGDTLTNIEMMDFLSSNMIRNNLEINQTMYNVGIDGKTYAQEDGHQLDKYELEQLLISLVFANPLELRDDSSLAGLDNEPGSYLLESLDLKSFSALEWVNEALENDYLTEEQKLELRSLQTSYLTEVSAEDWLKMYANNPDLAESLTDVEKIALGMISPSPLSSNSRLEITSYSDEQPVKLDIGNLNEYVLTSKAEVRSVLENKNINNIYFDFDRSYVNSEERKTLDEIAALMIANPSLDMYVSAHTDTRGSNAYNDALSEKRAQSVNAYLSARGVNADRLILGWFGEDELANNCTNDAECEENAHRLNRRASFALSEEIQVPKSEIRDEPEASATKSTDNSRGSLEGLENIYYDFDKSTIRQSAQGILNNIYEMMSANSESLLINAHTDIRGNNEYNDALSQRRANEAKQFLISKGIASDRIAVNWSGERQLARACENEKICSSSDHQLNRRASLTWK